jgi:rhodanese-related sulfurtransferase
MPDRHMTRDIDADDVQRLMRDEDALLIEVLPRDEYAEEHVLGAQNIPLTEMTAEAVGWIPRDRPVIVYCNDYF